MSDESLEADLTCIYSNLNQCEGRTSFDVFHEWPTSSELETTLHESQIAALRRMLTKKLAVVVGPPGTGKTYVTLKFLQILLSGKLKRPLDQANVIDERKPILIVCFTNHALDQLLWGIHEQGNNHSLHVNV